MIQVEPLTQTSSTKIEPFLLVICLSHPEAFWACTLRGLWLRGIILAICFLAKKFSFQESCTLENSLPCLRKHSASIFFKKNGYSSKFIYELVPEKHLRGKLLVTIPTLL